MDRARAQMLLMAITVAICGCGDQSDHWKDARPATAPASGTVTLQGKPLSGAIVVIHPTASGGIGASGLTNDKGEFQLSTFPPELGAVPGTYQVTIMKTEMPPQLADASNPDDPAPIHVISVIPAQYGTPDKSGLTAEIPEDGTDALTFDLTK